MYRNLLTNQAYTVEDDKYVKAARADITRLAEEKKKAKAAALAAKKKAAAEKKKKEAEGEKS
jgi:hypothetical protein